MSKITTASVGVTEAESIARNTWVEYRDGLYGLVIEKVSDGMKWPPDDDDAEKIGTDETAYIVARQSGGSEPFTEDELEAVERDTVFDEPPEEPEKDIDDAELAAVYKRCADPDEAVAFDKAIEQLLSVPGVEDPGVGWDSYPDSWRKSDEPSRLILLDAWTSMGATFRGCMTELRSRRLCASMKDEVLGTEHWRGRF